MIKVDRVINSDVLVIGGAGAAVMSAISAIGERVSVNIVSRGKIGKSGNTIMIGGGFGIDGKSAHDICGEENADQEFMPEELYENIIKNSFYLSDQKMVKQYVEKGSVGIKECLSWVKNAGLIFNFIPKASLWNTSGKTMGRAIAQGLSEYPDIKDFNDIFVVDLLKNDGRVCGALGIDIYSGDIIEFRAKSVVVATGGYQPFSLKNTASDMTGDGIAMGLRAGAKIKDMEFLLFIPTALEPHYIKGSIIPYLMTLPVYFPLKPTIMDMEGEIIKIDEKYNCIPPSNKMNKIFYAYFWGKKVWEKYSKYGNSFYFDFSNYTDSELEEGFQYMIDRVSTWHTKNHYNGTDLKKLCKYIINNDKKLRVGLGNEYSMGGIVVDEKFETGIPGLYAAGEVTAGVFGAFRSADGLTEMLAQGIDAGKQAALYAKKNELILGNNIDEILNYIGKPLTNKDGENAFEIINEIESICDEGFNFFRTEEKLLHSQSEMIKVRKKIENMKCSDFRNYNWQWISSIIADNLSICALMGITAANLRKESRGTHMRDDYPMVDNNTQLRNILFNFKNNNLEFQYIKPEVVNMKLPKGADGNIPDYILQVL